MCIFNTLTKSQEWKFSTQNTTYIFYHLLDNEVRLYLKGICTKVNKDIDQGKFMLKKLFRPNVNGRPLCRRN